jgi:hypothetical protein
MACLSQSSLLPAPLFLLQLTHERGLRRPRRRRAPAREGMQRYGGGGHQRGRMTRRRRAPSPSHARQARPTPCHLWWYACKCCFASAGCAGSQSAAAVPSLPRVGLAAPIPAPASRQAGSEPPRSLHGDAMEALSHGSMTSSCSAASSPVGASMHPRLQVLRRASTWRPVEEKGSTAHHLQVLSRASNRRPMEERGSAPHPLL